MTIKAQNKGSGLVYSTEFGKMCPGCNKPRANCICRKNQSIPENDGIVRLMRETKGRKGKGVTLITGVPLDNEELKKLVKSLISIFIFYSFQYVNIMIKMGFDTLLKQEIEVVNKVV